MDIQNKTHLMVFRYVALSWIVGWFIKLRFFSEYLLFQTVHYPMELSFFPQIFQNAYLAQSAYFLPLLLSILIFSKKQFLLKLSSLIMLSCSCILCWHINTFNDMTFVTSFWVALWLLWLSFNIHRDDADFPKQATALAVCIFGLIFLGGAVGKLTQEYIRGDVFYNIFFLQKPHGVFMWFKSGLSIPQQIQLAGYISKFVIFTEAVFALAPFLPSRLIRIGAPVILLGIILFSTWRILSVLACLIGMLSATFLWDQEKCAN